MLRDLADPSRSFVDKMFCHKFKQNALIQHQTMSWTRKQGKVSGRSEDSQTKQNPSPR